MASGRAPVTGSGADWPGHARLAVLGADGAGDVVEWRQRHAVSLAHVAEDVLHEARVTRARAQRSRNSATNLAFRRGSKCDRCSGLADHSGRWTEVNTIAQQLDRCPIQMRQAL